MLTNNKIMLFETRFIYRKNLDNPSASMAITMPSLSQMNRAQERVNLTTQQRRGLDQLLSPAETLAEMELQLAMLNTKNEARLAQ